jgi:hypothetical protein
MGLQGRQTDIVRVYPHEEEVYEDYPGEKTSRVAPGAGARLSSASEARTKLVPEQGLVCIPEGHTLLTASAIPLAAIKVATIILIRSSVLFTIIVCPIIFLLLNGRWVCLTPRLWQPSGGGASGKRTKLSVVL